MIEFKNSDRVAAVVAGLGAALATLGGADGKEWIVIGGVLMAVGAGMFLLEGFKKKKVQKP